MELFENNNATSLNISTFYQTSSFETIQCDPNQTLIFNLSPLVTFNSLETYLATQILILRVCQAPDWTCGCRDSK